MPTTAVYFALRDGSRNGGALDLDAYLAGRAQDLVVHPTSRYQLFRLGDAVASRNIHAAMYEARRLAMAL